MFGLISLITSAVLATQQLPALRSCFNYLRKRGFLKVLSLRRLVQSTGVMGACGSSFVVRWSVQGVAVVASVVAHESACFLPSARCTPSLSCGARVGNHCAAGFLVLFFLFNSFKHIDSAMSPYTPVLFLVRALSFESGSAKTALVGAKALYLAHVVGFALVSLTNASLEDHSLLRPLTFSRYLFSPLKGTLICMPTCIYICNLKV